MHNGFNIHFEIIIKYEMKNKIGFQSLSLFDIFKNLIMDFFWKFRSKIDLLHWFKEFLKLISFTSTKWL